MKRFLIRCRMLLLTLGIYLIAPFTSAAAPEMDNIGQTLLDESKRGIVELVDNLIGFLQVITGVAGIVFLVTVVFNIIQGDRDSAKKFAAWLAGITLGFIMLTVMGNLIKVA